MPVRACNTNAPQRSPQELDGSPSSSFRRFDTKKGSLTEEQVVGITQRIENKSTRKMKENIRRRGNTSLRALCSLLENALRDDYTGPSAEVTPDDGIAGLV